MEQEKSPSKALGQPGLPSHCFSFTQWDKNIADYQGGHQGSPAIPMKIPVHLLSSGFILDFWEGRMEGGVLIIFLPILHFKLGIKD